MNVTILILWFCHFAIQCSVMNYFSYNVVNH
uniref:Uncharacterized protein n=1 Tax=Anguilla anguilla TaxID=7936 RepID=A0A0E9VWG7_ANGAN